MPLYKIWRFLHFYREAEMLTHVVGDMSHKGLAQGALPASGGKDAVRVKIRCR